MAGWMPKQRVSVRPLGSSCLVRPKQIRASPKPSSASPSFAGSMLPHHETSYRIRDGMGCYHATYPGAWSVQRTMGTPYSRSRVKLEGTVYVVATSEPIRWQTSWSTGLRQAQTWFELPALPSRSLRHARRVQLLLFPVIRGQGTWMALCSLKPRVS